MPLYIDYHKLEGDLTIEDVRNAHRADLANQEKFGVRYIQLWVNKESATVFCLMEGPDSHSCIACHLASHGNTPCNIQEVEESLVNAFMGEKLVLDDHDMVWLENGELDTASRTIIFIDLLVPYKIKKESTGKVNFQKDRLFVESIIANNNGRVIERMSDDRIMGIFNVSINSFRCAATLREKFSKEISQNRGRLKISINHVQPLNRQNGFFELGVLQSQRMCTIAKIDQIIISSNLRKIYEQESYGIHSDHARVLTKQEESFLNTLFNSIENEYKDDHLSSEDLCKRIGISRTHLYRKLIGLTGMSLGQLVKEVRMGNAWNLLRFKKGNISQVCFETGYSSPSYFSKSFRNTFGYPPSLLNSICW